MLQKLYQTFTTKGKELPILIDVNAFRRKIRCSQPFRDPSDISALSKKHDRSHVAQIGYFPDSDGARMMLRNGAGWITAKSSASLENLLQEKVLAQIENRPLVNVVQDLSDMTGVSITLDPRVEEKASTRISVTFRNDVTLGGALRIVADMAGLKVVDMQSGLYITTPANAKELQKRANYPNPKQKIPTPPEIKGRCASSVAPRLIFATHVSTGTFRGLTLFPSFPLGSQSPVRAVGSASGQSTLGTHLLSRRTCEWTLSSFPTLNISSPNPYDDINSTPGTSA